LSGWKLIGEWGYWLVTAEHAALFQPQDPSRDLEPPVGSPPAQSRIVFETQPKIQPGQRVGTKHGKLLKVDVRRMVIESESRRNGIDSVPALRKAMRQCRQFVSRRKKTS
jgi:hypothetical protein